MTEVKSEITANVWLVQVSVGDTVKTGDHLVVLESMKMEIPVASHVDGVVTQVHVAPNDTVQEGAVLVSVDEA
jgi:biotin carboxyl carrier protein